MAASAGGTPEEQLVAIAKLVDVLDRHSVEFWLFGGWAVDFCVGRVTRPHEDIDLAAWQRDRDVIDVALEAAGWLRTYEVDETVAASYRWGSSLVEFTFVLEDDRGRVILPMPDGPHVWSTQPFGDETRTLLDVSCRTIPMPLLRAGKSVPREPADDAAKDRADYAALSGVSG